MSRTLVRESLEHSWRLDSFQEEATEVGGGAPREYHQRDGTGKEAVVHAKKSFDAQAPLPLLCAL